MKALNSIARKSYKKVLGGAFAGLALAFTALLFAGCENFLKGEDVQQEIKNVIEYNNSPDHVINVEALKDTGEIKTPATHEIEKKVTDVFPIRFEPDENHKFVKWEAIIQDLNVGEKPSDYIVFESPTSLETNVTFKKASSKVIIIRPICPPRLTYTFKQGDGDIYPRDSSIEFSFNQAIDESCLANVPVENYVTIQNLDEQDVQKYFKSPRVNDKKLVFNSDTTNGYIPIPNVQRSISVKIDKDKIWYVNKQYSEEVKITLDDDIKQSFIINSETSKKTHIKYELQQKDEKPLGTFKIDGQEIDNNTDYQYSVGQVVSLRYRIPEGYTFKEWEFKTSDGTIIPPEDLSLTFTVEDYTNNLLQTTFTVDNYISNVVFVTPKLYEPVKFHFLKSADDTGTFKVDKTPVTQEDQEFECGVGSSFVFNYKVASGYFYYGWDIKRTYTDEESGELVTEAVTIEQLKEKGITITYDDGTDENGFNAATGIAQAQVTIDSYTSDEISITPNVYNPIQFHFLKSADDTGTFKVDKTAITQEDQKVEYGVGASFTFYYKVAQGYYFYGWSFKRTYKDASGVTKTEAVTKEELKTLGISIVYDDNTDENGFNATTGIAQAQVTIEKYTADEISITPNVYNPIPFHFLKSADDTGTFKVDKTAITQEDQKVEYGVGASFTFNYKVAPGYYFYGWSFKRTYKDETGAVKTVSVTKEKLKELGISVVYEDNTDENGFNATTGIAQAQVTIDSYTPDEFSFSPKLYEPVKFNFAKAAQDTGIFKVEKTVIPQDEDKTIEFGVSSSFVCSYKLAADYYFYGWTFKRTYKDETGASKTEVITKAELEDYGITISTEEDTDENGYDKETRLAQINVSVYDYTDIIISITPVCFENLVVNSFNLSNSNTLYNRDSDIEFIFNKPLVESCKDNVIIKITGLSDGNSALDYFEAPVVSENKLTIKAKSDGEKYLIPVLLDGTNTVSITLPADEMLYEQQLSNNERINIGLGGDKTFTYKINTETKRKTQFIFNKVDGDVGVLRLDGIKLDNLEKKSYSIASTFQLTYTLSKAERKDYLFSAWTIKSEYEDENGVPHIEEIAFDDSDKLDELHITVETDEQAGVNDTIVYSAVLSVKDYSDNKITIQPKVTTIPDVKITINGGAHGLATVSGEQTYKLGELNHIEYKTDAAYSFIRWQLINSKTGNEISKTDGSYDYLESDTLDNEKFDFTITSLPDEESTIEFELRPIVVERPQIISSLPLSGSAVRKDTSIQVVFDYDMDEGSIYYTPDEIDELVAKLGLEVDYDKYDDYDEHLWAYGLKDNEKNVVAQLLYDGDMGEYYGYMYTNENSEKEYVYKNISIVNSNTAENLIQCFDPPYFENPRTLSMKVHRDDENNVSITKYSQILVTINENMFYYQDGKNVTMNGAKKWIYQVSNDTDSLGPHVVKDTTVSFTIDGGVPTAIDVTSLGDNITNANITSSGVTLKDTSGTELTTIPYFNKVNSNLIFEISDREGATGTEVEGSGVASTFQLRCTMLYNENYKKVSNGTIRNVGFASNSVGQTAEVDRSLNQLYNYLNSGIYSVELVFLDVCGNETVYKPVESDSNKKWCILIDKTAPSMTFADNVAISCTEEKTITMTLKGTIPTDYDKMDVRYWNISTGSLGSSTWDPFVPESDGITYKLKNLDAGYQYRILLRFYDKYGNVTGLKSVSSPYPYTMPDKPKSVTVSTSYGRSPTITVEKPASGYCSSISVKYRLVGDTNWTTASSIMFASGSTTGSSTYNLDSGKQYEFELRACIAAGNNNNGLYSLPYKTSSDEYPTYTTTPSLPTLSSVSYNNQKNSLQVNYTVPSSNYTGIKILYSKTSNFTNPGTISIAKAYATGGYRITSLEAGTKYYVKLVAYYINENNKVETAAKSAYTMPASLTELYSDESGYDWMSVDISYKPSGEYSGYNVYYKQTYPSTTSSSYIKANSTLVPASYDYYYIGEYEDGNVITPGKTYSVKVVTVLQDTENNVVISDESFAPSFTIEMSPWEVDSFTAKKTSSTSMQLTWTKPSGTYFEGYNIWYSTTNNFYTATRYNSSAISTSTTSYNLTGLTTGYYYVWIEDFVGTFNSSSRYYNWAMSRCSLALDSVSNLAATAQSTSRIDLSWTNLSDSNAYDGIEIYRKKDGEAESMYSRIATPSKTATSYSDTSLTPNVLYNYKVVTYKGSGSSKLTADSTINRRTYSSPVTSFSASVQGPNSVKLSWANPSNSSYYNQIKIYNGSALVTTLDNGTTTYTVTGLTGGNSYTFYVKTTNNTSWDSISYPSGITVRTKVASVTNLTTSTRSQNSITISWTKAAGNVTGYYVYYKLSSASGWTSMGSYDASTTSVTKSGLSAGVKYDFEVDTYYTVSGTKYWSSAVTLSSSTRPPAPSSFTVSSQSNNYINLSWSNPNSANYDYVRIYYRKATASSWSSVDVTKGDTSYSLSLDYGYRYIIYGYSMYNGWGYATDYIYTQTYPYKPSNLVVNSNEGYLTATWTPTNIGENKYKIAWHKPSEGWTISDPLIGYDSCSLGLDHSQTYYFAVFAYNDFSGYGNNLRSSDLGYPTYITPPADISSITVTSSGTGSNTSWTFTINNWSTITSPAPDNTHGNIFVDGVYKGGVSTSGKFYLSGDLAGHTVTVVPYHTLSSTGRYESLEPETLYDGSKKNLTTWEDETYAHRFTIRKLSTGTKYGD